MRTLISPRNCSRRPQILTGISYQTNGERRASKDEWRKKGVERTDSKKPNFIFRQRTT